MISEVFRISMGPKIIHWLNPISNSFQWTELVRRKQSISDLLLRKIPDVLITYFVEYNSLAGSVLFLFAEDNWQALYINQDSLFEPLCSLLITTGSLKIIGNQSKVYQPYYGHRRPSDYKKIPQGLLVLRYDRFIAALVF